ncbi:hypothetical protein M5C99_07620 [Acidovorax sp. NCPPB 2350]|nr:hypothetical protein M5C99_07620 [Acidovorax sp. NCPPB 2350]
MKRYLEELEALTRRSVQSDELGSLEQAAAMRMAAQRFDAQSSTRYEIRFSDRNSERFKKFLQGLMDANPSSVYVWTPRTIDCGALLVPSLESIRFDFDFTINDEGILAFTTSDLGDSLLLEFSSTPAGEQIMKIETQGPNWAKAVY